MNEADAVHVMAPTIAVYAQRLHGRFQHHLVSWTVEDLRQEGALAVALACRTFDPTRSAFPTYARIRIWGAMVDYVRRGLPGTRHRRVVLIAIEDLPGGIDWMPETRLPCTCTATHQPCPACLAWRERRPHPGDHQEPPAPLEAHRPGATTPLLLPLSTLEIVWL